MTRQLVLMTDHDMPSIENPDVSLETKMFHDAGFELVLIQCTRHPREESCKSVIRAIKSLPSPPVAIISHHSYINKAVFEAAGPSLKCVGKLGTGTDIIDREAAKELNIPVRWVPNYSNDECSDHTIAMIMALHRNLIPTNKDCKAGDWSLKNANHLRRTSSQVVGIFGYGAIGKEAGRKAAALGFQTIAYSPSLDPNDKQSEAYQKARLDNVTIVSREELQQRSDFISFHLPSTASTKHLVNSEFLSQCKPGVTIVNTGRGTLIDEKALLENLRSKNVTAAALDVRETEPPSKPDVFAEFDNVIQTPHTAFTTIESRTQLKSTLAEEIIAVLNNEHRPLGNAYGRA